MTLFQMTGLIALTGLMASAGIRFWLDRAEEAGPRADLESVRILALDYARHFCSPSSTPPASPEGISQAATRIMAQAPGVLDPDRWSIRLESRSGGAGDRVLVRYRAAADDPANAAFLGLPGAVRTAGHIEIPVFRNPAGNRSGFRWLMSDESC